LATGMSKPLGCSNSSAGPPPGILQARSVTAAISRSGLTGSAIRVNSRRLSRSAMKSVMSEYMSWCRRVRRRVLNLGVHPLGDLRSQLQRAASLDAVDKRGTAALHGVHEIGQLPLQRLLILDRQLPAVDRRHRTVAFRQPPHLELLCGVVDRQVG